MFSHSIGSPPPIFGSSFLDSLFRSLSNSGSHSAPIQNYFGNTFSDRSLSLLPSHFGTFESFSQPAPPPPPPNTPETSAASRNAPPPQYLTLSELTAALRPILQKLDLVYNLQSFMVLDVAHFRDWFIVDYCKRFGVTPPRPTFSESSSGPATSKP